MKDWLRQLFTIIDRRDSEGFTLFLTDEATFRFANAPAITGKENIRREVGAFFLKIKSLRHHITGIWEFPGVVICEGEVIYTRKDDTQETLPFVDVLRMKDDLIADYRIYTDISPLFGGVA